MLKRWTINIAAVVAWLVVGALALLIIAIGASLFQMFIVVTLRVNHYAIQILIQTYYVVMGLLWLGFFILMDHILIDKAAKEGLLLSRTLYVLGIELLTIGVVQLALITYGTFNLLHVLLMGGELLSGAGLVYFFRRKKTKRKLETS